MVITERRIDARPNKMSNPSNKPTLIFREDGTHVPTCKGLLHSPETKLIIASANSEPKKESQVIKQSSVYERILPFVARELAVWEILCIMEPSLSRKQIRNAVYRNRKGRPEWHRIPEDYFSPEKESIRRSKGTINGLQKKLDRKSLIESKVLIQEFWKANLISTNISNWHELHALYQRSQRELPEDSFDRLRLEVFFTAMSIAESELDPTLLNKYRELVDKIASAGSAPRLSSEEQFIKSKICNVWRYDGEDKTGLFYYNRHGSKSYILGEEGSPYETSESLQKRRAFRQMDQNGRTNTNNRY
ncbi:MAG: hypothetical protein Q8P29_01750 [Candidatus Levybacteria bacterium]|nr:hypothetical protein [Candidatus Levybacteria bacterium]